MKLLIVYGTTEGQTRKICTFLRDEAKKAGHEVSLNDTTRTVLHPDGFDAIVVGASLHAEKYQSSVKHYIREHSEVLNNMLGVFMSVSLTAAANEPESWEELKTITDEFLKVTGWQPDYVEQVAGALRYSKYNFFKKFIMRMIAQKSGGDTDPSKDYEYTDWEQVKAIVAKLEKDFIEQS
ncbi:flavodoxin domain-containing protein [Fodinibius salsisoli]|uniref:Flavodoxin domain-containing protein n=1 Tax=Fodinibius salsisoli TaxID=2820877 RepID=A0ABT3PIU1_9BACT|nr:flavodoxin domain-containing protein [Fodinibius salsisoli]MCW9705842.1 hypothetical protein [Fodinibius salsisoli]